MGRMSKNETARHEGAAWLLRLAKEKGLEEAEKELEWRGVKNCPLQIEKSEIKRYEREIRDNSVKSLACMALLVLHDEFGWESAQLVQFMNRFDLKSEVIDDDFATWTDYARMLKEDTGIDIDPEGRWEATEDEFREWRKKEAYERSDRRY